MGAPRVLALLGITAFCAGLVVYERLPGDDRTDSLAERVAKAIVWPRPGDAAGYARAALHGRGGPDFQVLSAVDLQADDPTPALAEPMVRLVVRIRMAASEPVKFGSADPAVTACYEVEFDYYDIADGPDRIACPADATPYVPPPLPPPWRVPEGSDEAVRGVLASLPASAERPAVVAAVSAALPPPLTDPETGLTARAPGVAALVRGETVAVAVHGGNTGNGIDCLFGTREGTEVTVWHAGPEVQPGELTCDPETALYLRDR